MAWSKSRDLLKQTPFPNGLTPIQVNLSCTQLRLQHVTLQRSPSVDSSVADLAPPVLQVLRIKLFMLQRWYIIVEPKQISNVHSF